MNPVRNAIAIPRFKIFDIPLLSFAGSSLDLSAMVGLVILFFLGLAGLLHLRRKTPWRYGMQILAMGLFVLGVHQTLCLLRGWIFGVELIGYDDYMAFAYIHVCVTLTVIGIVSGGFFCGWLCPVGVLQEIVGRNSARFKRWMGSRMALWFDLLLSAVTIFFMVYLLWYYAPADYFLSENVSALFVLAGVMLLPFILFYPALDRKIRWLREVSLVLRIGIVCVGIWETSPGCTLYADEVDYAAIIGLGGLLLASGVLTRAYCRHICPFGGLFGRLSMVAIFKIDPRPGPCPEGCDRCSQVCPMDALRGGTISHSDCVLCGRCVEQCGSTVTVDLPVPSELPAGEPAEGGRAGSRDGGPWVNMRAGSAGRGPGEPEGRAGSRDGGPWVNMRPGSAGRGPGEPS